MSELEEIGRKFGTSKPVFQITIDNSDATDVALVLKNKYVPPKSEDPIFNLVAETWSERFDKSERSFIYSVNVELAYSKIMDRIKQFVINTSALKNPKQSTLYKWLSLTDHMYKDSLSAGFIALYRYMFNNNVKPVKDHSCPRVNNILAVLELMKEKNEDKKSSH